MARANMLKRLFIASKVNLKKDLIAQMQQMVCGVKEVCRSFGCEGGCVVQCVT